ncbi:NifU N-terminal domain-containing protein [Thermodesulfobacteriota bacterium]
MDKPTVDIYHHPNPEIKSFLMEDALIPPYVERFKSPLDETSHKTLKKLGFIGAQVVKDIMNVPGISEIRIKPKEIIIKKELSFSWDDLEAKIMNILGRALKRKQIKAV